MDQLIQHIFGSFEVFFYLFFPGSIAWILILIYLMVKGVDRYKTKRLKKVLKKGNVIYFDALKKLKDKD